MAGLPSPEGRGVVDIRGTVVENVVEDIESGQLCGQWSLIDTETFRHTLHNLQPEREKEREREGGMSAIAIVRR